MSPIERDDALTAIRALALDPKLEPAIALHRIRIIFYAIERPPTPTMPPGWSPFGTHLDEPYLEFSRQTDEDGLPLWERPLLRQEP